MSRPQRTTNNKPTKAAKRERRAFGAEFKQDAVRLMHERRAAGVTMTQIARELDLRPEQLREWARKLTPEDGTAPGETPEQELRRLRREVTVLRQESEFAKKVAVYFAKESR
jgi:transposase